MVCQIPKEYTKGMGEMIMKAFVFGKQVCKSVEEAKAYLSTLGRIRPQGLRRVTAWYDGSLVIHGCSRMTDKDIAGLACSNNNVLFIRNFEDYVWQGVSDDIANYIAGGVTSSDILRRLHVDEDNMTEEQADSFQRILADANTEFLALPCDDDGPTPEQNVELDWCLDSHAHDIYHVFYE